MSLSLENICINLKCLIKEFFHYSYTVVHKTEVIKSTLNPTWRPTTVSARVLCNGDYDRYVKFKISVFLLLLLSRILQKNCMKREQIYNYIFNIAVFDNEGGFQGQRPVNMRLDLYQYDKSNINMLVLLTCKNNDDDNLFV